MGWHSSFGAPPAPEVSHCSHRCPHLHSREPLELWIYQSRTDPVRVSHRPPCWCLCHSQRAGKFLEIWGYKLRSGNWQRLTRANPLDVVVELLQRHASWKVFQDFRLPGLKPEPRELTKLILATSKFSDLVGHSLIGRANQAEQLRAEHVVQKAQRSELVWDSGVRKQFVQVCQQRYLKMSQLNSNERSWHGFSFSHPSETIGAAKWLASSCVRTWQKCYLFDWVNVGQ